MNTIEMRRSSMARNVRVFALIVIGCRVKFLTVRMEHVFRIEASLNGQVDHRFS